MLVHPLKEKIDSVIKQVQPVLGLHGGSIKVVDISEDNVVSILFQGACVGCAAADLTLEYGLKEMLMMQVEEITDVIAVNTEPVTHSAPSVALPYARN
jgi:Fe/S biogenesis protein NfuA